MHAKTNPSWQQLALGRRPQDIAAYGVSGGGSALPFRDRIQASAGHHDLSDISAHIGGAAAEASAALGAEAYATGSNVAFASSPSLHTAAHEAAHVVQQRRGVSLKGGMGEKADIYERHADEVADAVVAGRSAEALLDNVPRGGGGAGAAVQRQEPDEATQPPMEDPEAAVPTKGDEMRKAILETAEKRLKKKTTIVSAEHIQDIREGMVRIKEKTPDGNVYERREQRKKPVKNYTTCIEFAGQTFGDAAQTMGKDQKDATLITKRLPNILTIFNQEIQLQAQIDAFKKAVKNFAEAIAKIENRKETFKNKKGALEGEKKRLEASKTGDPLKDKVIDQQIKGLHLQMKGQDQALRQLDAAIAMVQKEQQRFQTKVDKLQGDKTILGAQGKALVRAAPGLGNGRPKPGEYILLGAAATQPYVVNNGTPVSLAKGSFKHIAVFKSLEAVPSPKDSPDEKWEKWHTIDGGNTTAKATDLYIRLSDLRVQFLQPDTSWASSSTALIGWIDMNTLMSDQDSTVATK